jgi:hypothetical protein
VQNPTYPADPAERQLLVDKLDATGYKPTQVKRKMDVQTIEEYATDMQNDQTAFWARFTTTPIRIGPGEEIMNGHHRIIAAALAGQPSRQQPLFEQPSPAGAPHLHME